jgi:putative DNA primase/helicase
MRIDGELVGCQVVDADGGKKFLFGQKTANASFDFDNKGKHYLCEGYATALSLRHALRSLKRNYVIHVCFSAGNLLKLAQKFGGFVIADNDESGTGERVAKQAGLPYWMSDVVGEDANDAHQRLGLFKFTQSLTKSLPIR